MAESDTAVAEQTDAVQYSIKIEDAGPATKKVVVEIPADVISAKLTEQFADLRSQANIPGFRVGRAPKNLIEKRFGEDVREQVKRSLISESYQQAVEKNSLQVLGEPEFENPEAIKLPEGGNLTYTFSIEVQPTITLPDMGELTVKKPKVEVTEENVNTAVQNLREQQGTLVPVEDRGIENGDYLTADIHLKLDGNVVAHQHDAQLVARAGRINGIQIDDLGDKLAGLKSGETRSFKVTAPETHGNDQIKGKEVEIEVKLKDIKKLELVEITPEFLAELGFENEQQLRDALKEQMVERINSDVQNAMRSQVHQYLLEKTNVELPAKLSEKQEERIINRRGVDLMMKGVPREQVEANIEQLKHGAKDEAARELKLFFILEKIATDQGVDVTEGELNGQIAMMAIQRGQRPEKMKQEMAKNGQLQNMYVQLREQKAIDKLLETAKVEEVEVGAEGEKKAE